MAATHGTPTGDLNALGITPSGEVYWNLDAPALIELAVARNEGVYSAHRALVTETGAVSYTHLTLPTMFEV